MATRTRAEKKANKPQLSAEALSQAQTITNTVVPVSFTKQQRREVQLAIESGMATIRTQANSKNRDRDKKLKQLQKQLAIKESDVVTTTEENHSELNLKIILPWGLLLLTWIGLAIYFWTFV